MTYEPNPLTSLVVPTRNRHTYLVLLARALLASVSRDFELLIYDNSDNPGGFEAAGGVLGDSRLRYFYDPTPMSITQNFEKALSQAQGDYVCMIGDDDGVTEGLFVLVRWLKQHNIDAATTIVATYLWPGVESSLDGKQTTGVLRIPRYSSCVEFVDSSSALEAVLASGGTSIGNLPSVYQGIVSRRALDRLIKLTGTRFPGPSPDMANAIGLSAVIDRFAFVSFPVVISGSCNVSGAAEGARHQHQGEIADKRFLPPDTAKQWPPKIPFYFSGPTIWAATVIHALAATGRSSAALRLRYDRLYAACHVFTPRFSDRVVQVRGLNPGTVSTVKFRMAIAWIWHLRARALIANLWCRIQSRVFSKMYVSNISDIRDAMTHTMRESGQMHTENLSALLRRSEKMINRGCSQEAEIE